MFRMSQKLLILFFTLLISLANASEWKLIGSIETGPSGIHLKNPLSVFVSANSIIYVTDSQNGRFISYSEKLKPLKQFNAGGELKTPAGMIKDSNGNIWYIERATNSIGYINLREKKIIKKNLNIFPDRISIYKDNIVVVDRFSGKIDLINKNFQIIKKLFPVNKSWKGFYDVKVKDDKICGMENLTGRIFCFNMVTNKKSIIKIEPKLVQPVSFDIDKDSNVYIIDRYLKKVLIFNSSGKYVSSMLTEGERPGELYYPWQILIKNNRIFIVDEGNGRIDVFKL